MTFWNFWHDHLFLAWCALWLIWGAFSVAALPFKIINRIIRSINIAIRGWPPAHLDADGDWKKKE